MSKSTTDTDQVLMGMYTAVSFTLNFYDVPADAAGMQR